MDKFYENDRFDILVIQLTLVSMDSGTGLVSVGIKPLR